MRLRASIAFVLTCALGAPHLAGAAGASAAPEPAGTPVASDPVTRVLPNGLQVVAIRDDSAPVVATELIYHFGSHDETPGKTGLAHALEHMMFRGTQTISYAGLEAYLARIGARFDAQTDTDSTRFDFTVPVDRLGSILRIEADRMQHLKLDPEQWNLERGAVLSELDNAYDNPLFRFVDAVDGRTFRGTPYDHVALGARADVVAATTDDLRRYYEAYYTPSNATLVIVGDLDPNDAIAAADHAFAGVPDRPAPAQPTPVVPHAPAQPDVVERHDAFPFQILDLSYAVPGGETPAGYDLQNFVNTVEDPRSPFFQKIVGSGLAIAGIPVSNAYDGAGSLQFVYLIAPGHTPAEVRAVFETELAAERQNGPPADLVDYGRAKFRADIAYARESFSTLASYLGELAAYHYTPEQDDALTAAVTPESIAATLRATLVTPSVVGILDPTTTNAKAAAPPSLSGAAEDTFGGRVPDGPVNLPPDLAAEAPSRPLLSQILPTEFTVAGMRVLVQPQTFSGTVIVTGFVRTSPASDPPGETGLGEVASAAMRYGSTVDDLAAVERKMGSIGADLELGTSFSAHARAADFDAVIEELAAGLRHPAYPADYVTLTKRQLAEVAGRRDRVQGYAAQRALQQLLVRPGDPTLRVATPASYEAITREQLLAYAAKNVRPELTTVAVVGDVDPAHVRSLFERVFGDWRGEGATPDVDLPPLAPSAGARRVVSRPGTAIDANFAAAGVARSSPDYDALSVASFLLGGAFDSVLMSEIREKRGLAYTVSSNLDAERDRGSITIDLKADPAKFARARAILRTELRTYGEQTAQPGQVYGAERALASKFTVDQVSLGAIAGDVLEIGAYGLPADYDRTVYDRYRTIGPERVRDVIRRYLDPDRLVEVDEGPVP